MYVVVIRYIWECDTYTWTLYAITCWGPRKSPNVTQSLTSQEYRRVVLGAFHSILVVEFSWSSLRSNCDSYVGYWNIGDELFWGKIWSWMNLWILDYSNWRKWRTRKHLVLSLKKRPLGNQIHLENEKNVCMTFQTGTTQYSRISTNSHAKMRIPQ
jgi:hypothetical protein